MTEWKAEAPSGSEPVAPPKVLYLTQFFEPEPILKGAEFVAALEHEGLIVDTVTGFPNYPRGRLYQGYALAWHREDRVGGITVHRVPLYPNHGRSSVGRIFNYFSFAFSALLFGIFRAKKYDVIYAYPPPPTALAAALLGALRRIPFVMDIQDLWPDSVTASSMWGTRLMERPLSALCNFCYRRAARIVSQSQGIAERLIERGVDPAKISVIHNWARESDEDSPAGPPKFDVGRFTFLYAGNLGLVQQLDTLMLAAREAAREAPEIQLVLIGNGADRDRLASLVDELSLADVVRILDPVDRGQIGAILTQADVLTMHLQDLPLFSITIPHKTQSYMAAGKPILACVAGEAAEIVTDAGAGLVCRSGDVNGIAAAMVSLARSAPEALRAMGDAGRSAFGRRFTIEVAAAATARCIRDAIHQPVAGSASAGTT